MYRAFNANTSYPTSSFANNNEEFIIFNNDSNHQVKQEFQLNTPDEKDIIDRIQEELYEKVNRNSFTFDEIGAIIEDEFKDVLNDNQRQQAQQSQPELLNFNQQPEVVTNQVEENLLKDPNPLQYQDCREDQQDEQKHLLLFQNDREESFYSLAETKVDHYNQNPPKESHLNQYSNETNMTNNLDHRQANQMAAANHNNNNTATNNNHFADTKPKPFVEIVEQPSKCSLRFRYKCEGRSAGSLPGMNSTADNKTYPSIRIANYVGRAVVVISLVTKDAPYRAHPHNIVGKDNCKKGVCTIIINNELDTIRTFSSLGIQCVKKKDIEESLKLRQIIKVDPFRNGFDHMNNTSNIDLNVVRLCFQVFIEGSKPGVYDIPLAPVVSDPIHDKKAMSDLVITKLSHCSAPATGGREVILLCDRISKDDIQIRFYEERDGKLIWETYTELSPTDVHKQVAICFKTPKYRNENITQPVMCRIQLKRVSDNQVSEPRLFQFLPCESDEDIISRKRQKIEWVRTNHYALDNIFHQAPLPNGDDQQLPVQIMHPNFIQHQNQQQQQQQQLQQHHLHQQQLQQFYANQRPQTSMSQPQQYQQQLLQVNQQQQNTPNASPSPLQGVSPAPLLAQRTSSFSRPPSHSPRPSSSSPSNMETSDSRNRFVIDNPNYVVRREIIDNDGKVMRLVDRPIDQQQQQQQQQPLNQRRLEINDNSHQNNLNNTNPGEVRQLGNSLDRIDTAELMRDMQFNSNIDLNLGSGLSLHLNGCQQENNIHDQDNQQATPHNLNVMTRSDKNC